MRSNETVIVLQVLKQLHAEVAALRVELHGVRDAVQRVEHMPLANVLLGATYQLDDAADGDDSDSTSVHSAP
tara:strand:+ start:223 stop:438 length:216 start_codon:yes stop_codon:yes gene_type:complete